MPAQYGLKKVDALPPKRSGGGGRSINRVLTPLFEKAAGEPGTTFEIARYESATGASTAKRTIEKRATEILPAGVTFDIEARRTGEKESVLYVRALPESEDIEEAEDPELDGD